MAQINKPSEYFNTKLYTGNGSTQSITGVGHQPDLVWIKHRNNATLWNHSIHDSVRGSTKYIASNTTDQENTDANSVTSFNSDGFSIGTFVKINDNGVNHVAWNWKANGAGSSNTDGSITSTVSANTTSGFSIVTYTGNSTAGATIGHGLGVAPSMVIFKKLNGTSAWSVYHKSLGNGYFINLQDTGASTLSSTFLNNTSPSSSVITLGEADNGNTSGATYVAYCFAEKKGFSKFGSYVGNASASDNAFVYCGFKPAFLITKCSSIAGDRWTLYDNKRDPYNYVYRRLFPDGDIAESANTDADIDFLSNGFKIREGGNSVGDNYTYIYMAFAEHPFVSSTGTPTTAR